MAGLYESGQAPRDTVSVRKLRCAKLDMTVTGTAIANRLMLREPHEDPEASSPSDVAAA